jgi:FeS assembly SUF system regulator
MIRIGKMTDYGIVLLSSFVRDQEKAHNARDLSEESRIPLPTVSKILKELSRGALLTSQRGSKGGYRLAKSPDTISVAEVIQALEGPIGMTECTAHKPGACDLESYCPVRTNWRKINGVVLKALENLSLYEMARPFPVALLRKGINP